MTYKLTVSPDYPPEDIAGWYIFNTWLQRKLDCRFHFEMFDSFEAQRAAIARDEIDLIYANPFDASMLVREKGFTAIAAPQRRQDEVVVAASVESGILKVEDLRPGSRIALTSDPDVNLIGMIMLEPADLNRDNTETMHVSAYVIVAKQLLQGKADIGFFLKDAFDNLSKIVRRDLHPLVTSQISVVRHVMLLGPRAAAIKEPLVQALLAMQQDLRGASVLSSMGLSGWEAQTMEDTEFMIDLMDTLVE